MAIVRINDFRAAAGKETALRDFLRDVIQLVRSAEGCENCVLLGDPEDATRLVIVETWASVAAHQAAASRIPPDKLARVRPLLAEPPRGRYHDRLEPP